MSEIALSGQRAPGPRPFADQKSASHREFAEELRELLDVLRRGWRLVALSVAACLTIAVIVIAGTTRVYQATARLLILQQGGRPLNVVSNDPTRAVEANEDYLPTHAAILRSPVVVGRAIESIGLKGLPTLAGSADPTGDAIKQLTVTRPDRTAKVLQIDYQARSREEAVRFVAAIVDNYRKFFEASSQKNNGDLVSLITRAREGLRVELNDLEKGYLEFRRANPILTNDEAGRSFLTRRLEMWDRAASEAATKAVLLRSQLKLGRTLAGGGTSLWAIAHAMGQLGGDPNGALITQAAGASQGMQADYVRQLHQEQQQLAERFGPNYSKVRELQDQITRTQERSRDSQSRLDKADSRDLLGSIEQSLESIEAIRAEYARMFAEELTKAKAIELDLLAEASLKANLERHRALFNTVVDQLKQAQLVGDYNSVVAQPIEAANALRHAVRPRITLTLALALLAGCVIGMGAAVVFDRLDSRVHTPEEMFRALDLAVIGMIPRLPDDQSALAPDLAQISHRRPRSLLAEAYKATRTSLEMIRRERGVKVILVTSPMSGDGKSTITSNLAISLAQAGRRVLLIDADLRRPSQDRIHGLRRDIGLVHLLWGTMPLEKAVQPSAVPNLDLIAVGPIASGPAELLMSPRMGQVIEEARQSYDIVIIDSSPLLAVTDPSIIGSMVDGLILVARVSAVNRRDARRAVEVLQTLGTPILGTIINGVSFARGSSGYGYGTYGEAAHPAGKSEGHGEPDSSSGELVAALGDGAVRSHEQNGFHP